MDPSRLRAERTATQRALDALSKHAILWVTLTLGYPPSAPLNHSRLIIHDWVL